MKLILPAVATTAAIVLATFVLLIPEPIITSKAFASKMNGKEYGCSDGENCMGARYKAATKAKTKAPTKTQ
jgi:hypothetical protein